MKVYIIFKSFSSMKCVSVVSVAKHGIISTLMFQIDFFKWAFSQGTADLPETYYAMEQCRVLHVTFMQQENSAFTMSAILLTLCKPHIPEALSVSFSQITPGSISFYHYPRTALMSPQPSTSAHVCWA